MNIRYQSIDKIGLQNSSCNVLHRMGVHTVGELLCLTESDLNAAKGMGKKRTREILDIIEEIRSGEYEKRVDSIETEDKNCSLACMSIASLNLGVRSINGLTKANVETLGDLCTMSREDLMKVPNLGAKSVNEIEAIIAEWRPKLYETCEPSEEESIETVTDPENLDLNHWMAQEENHDAVIAYLKENQVQIEELSTLSTKAYNALFFSDHMDLFELVDLMESDLLKIEDIDKTSAGEVRLCLNNYIRSILPSLKIRRRKPGGSGTDEEIATEDIPIEFLFATPEYQPKILEYVKNHDIRIEDSILKPRAKNRLLGSNYHYVSELIFVPSARLAAIYGMGVGSANEIREFLRDYREKHESNIRKILLCDDTGDFSDDEIREMVLSTFEKNAFVGLHFDEIVEKATLKNVDPMRIKGAIGKLIKEGLLEYTDYCCYRKYVSFVDYLKMTAAVKDREREVVLRRLGGMSLEETAAVTPAERGERISRERVRQIVNKVVKKVYADYRMTTGLSWFDEDYYAYFFQTYQVDKATCINWLGMPIETYRYLEAVCKEGTKSDLELAAEDRKLDVGLRLKLTNYIRQKLVLVDGRWIHRSRVDLFKTFAAKYLTESKSYPEVVDLYNAFVDDLDLDHEDADQVRIGEDNIKSFENHLDHLRPFLSSQGRKVRYYDVDGKDYEELLNTLELDSYENIQISTLKFFTEYPELMKKYDIRDEYELHNLLKKIQTQIEAKDLKFKKMPVLEFGTFDRVQSYYDLMREHAPIALSDLTALIQNVYGFDARTVASSPELQKLDAYYHQGMYSVEEKIMSDADRNLFLSHLPRDLYYYDELKTAFLRIFPKGDPEMVNPYNLKKMGFLLGSSVAVKNADSFEAYFRKLLLSEKYQDIFILRKRHTKLSSWSNTFWDMKRDYEIVEVEPNKIMTVAYLEEKGITKQMLRDFCDAVFFEVPDHRFFSMKSLRQSGFKHELLSIGFEDWFYANLLCCDERFSFTQAFQTIILCKGKTNIMMRDVIVDAVTQKGWMDLSELERYLEDMHGCIIGAVYKIVEKISDTSLYYDRWLSRLYASYELFSKDLDEGV